MAVWGAPIAHEDDAERAVRAGARARRRGPARSGRASQARAGVLTGEAAVTLGATARAWSPATSSTPPRGSSRPRRRARSSSARRPSAPRRARSPSSRPASSSLKGKAAPVPAWRALRVVARARRPRPQRRGSRRRSSAATTELRLLKDLFHATGARAAGPARLVIGPGGHRQEPPRLGVPEVPRRRRRERLLARRPLARLRRGHHVLGARRDGPPPGRPRRDRRRGDDPREGRRDGREHVPDESERAGSSRPSWPCSASARRRPAGATSCSRAWRTFFERIAATGTS